MSTTTTISSREFNQLTSEAKKAASKGPVIITDRGQPSHVLLSIAEYRRLTVGTSNIADLLAMPDADAAELEFSKMPDLARSADLE
jgi:prevent-host-death family protein